jgi:hypothetical protein
MELEGIEPPTYRNSLQLHSATVELSCEAVALPLSYSPETSEQSRTFKFTKSRFWSLRDDAPTTFMS